MSISTPTSLLRRLGAILYDSLVCIALLMLATAVLLPLNGGEAFNSYGLNTVHDSGIFNKAHMINFAYQIYLYSLMGIYFVWCWHKGGQTLGMRAWNISLERCDHGVLSIGLLIKRFLLATILILPAGLGLWWSLFNPFKQTLYDKICGTQVVHNK